MDVAALELPGVAAEKPKKPARKKSGASAAHKRKASGSGTHAFVDVSGLASDGVLTLCVNDVLTKNDRHIRTSHGIAESSLSKSYKAAVAVAAKRAGFSLPVKINAGRPGKVKVEMRYGEQTIASGLWALTVISVWPTARHLGGVVGDLAYGDSDAPLGMVRDAMQRAGIIDDDMRIVVNHTDAIYGGPGQRRTIARLVRLNALDHAQRADTIASMLAAEKQAVAPSPC